MGIAVVILPRAQVHKIRPDGHLVGQNATVIQRAIQAKLNLIRLRLGRKAAIDKKFRELIHYGAQVTSGERSFLGFGRG